ILAIAPKLKLITFDGDMTLYGDGKDFEQDSELVKLLVKLLEFDFNVCVVTAAGYPGDAQRYEQRLSGLLKGFEKTLQRCINDMKLPCTILRKSRAVGIVPQPNVKIFREQLDECVLSTQHSLISYLQSSSGKQHSLPFCAFNGGSDVWVDIGNKLIGVRILQNFLGATPAETLHVGDQ
ncbi:13018_t:CDS:2, partial [Dentiscutata erythropus]